ncbi:MAG: hypothetical protein ABI233_06970 [Chthoniobacterales bacterium]
MSVPLRGKLIGGFLLVFVAGGVAGSFLGVLEARHHQLDFSQHGSLVEKVRDRMQSRLDLTPEQLKETDPILDHAARQLEEIRAETGKRLREVFTETDRQLTPHLTDAQRRKMEELEAQRKAAAAAATKPESD